MSDGWVYDVDFVTHVTNARGGPDDVHVVPREEHSGLGKAQGA